MIIFPLMLTNDVTEHGLNTLVEFQSLIVSDKSWSQGSNQGKANQLGCIQESLRQFFHLVANKRVIMLNKE